MTEKEVIERLKEMRPNLLAHQNTVIERAIELLSNQSLTVNEVVEWVKDKENAFHWVRLDNDGEIQLYHAAGMKKIIETAQLTKLMREEKNDHLRSN